MNMMLPDLNKEINIATELNYTIHSIKRCQQRAVSNWALEQAIMRGEKIHKQGQTFHFLKRKFVINNYHPHQHNQLFNLVVLVAEDNTIITAYKNPEAVGLIKRKPKRLAKRKSLPMRNDESMIKQNLDYSVTRIAA